ncbi:GNAT family N-acetyltransferase [Salmonirosea aquatica]|uniref:GNAT family N-acetyltransferase n=1 Tax=Salmonirosea aquatica TaxID=2654236 RepID=A0A7C9FA42_9BACT|nr:GNAT family N-acetyltransferase [Cytophagaceae bacterium SJW1-29]
MNYPSITNTIYPIVNPLAMTRTLHQLSKGLEIKEVFYPNQMTEIGKFRIRGWKNESGVNPDFFAKDLWLDEIDRFSHHWVATVNQTIVAVSRLSFHDSLSDVPYANLLKPEHRPYFENRRIASINRLVVAPEYRGMGLAGQMDRIRIECATRQADVMIAFPQLSRIESLQRKGFVLIEQLENIPEMPERPFFVMALDLKKGSIDE